MRTTGIFTVHRFEIEYDEVNKPIYLIPFGDVHKTSPMHHAERWAEFLYWARSKKRAYFLGMGDYDDLGSTSERNILADRALHESTVMTLEDLYLNNTKRFAKDIAFMRGRLIGLLGGNHYGEFQNGMTTDHKLCELLDCKYLGVSSFIRLSFRPKTKHTGFSAIDIFAHHGRGGGRTAGASMNPVYQMADIAEADIYLMGDNHQKAINHKSRLRLNSGPNLRLSHRKILCARTGSFLKGYEENCKSYLVDGAFNPTDLGVVKIELTPRREYKDKSEFHYVDIHASI